MERYAFSLGDKCGRNDAYSPKCTRVVLNERCSVGIKNIRLQQMRSY